MALLGTALFGLGPNLGCEPRGAEQHSAPALGVGSSDGTFEHATARGRRRTHQDAERAPSPTEVIAPARALGPTAERADADDRGDPRSVPVFEQLGYAKPVAQVVACGALGFVRLTEPGFEVYSYEAQTRIARYRDGEFSHVIEQPGFTYLLVGAGPSLSYYQASPRLTALAHVPALGPFSLWADPQDHARVWVHYAKDDAVVHLALARNPERMAELLGTIRLPNYDGALLTRLTAGPWLFSAHGEAASRSELRIQFGDRTAWLGSVPESSQAASAGFGTHVLLLSAERALDFEVTPLERLAPRGAVELSARPWAAASEGRRTAVLGQRVVDGRRTWSVQVIEQNRTRAVIGVSFDDAASVEKAARRGVCLAPGRPWVIIGGPHELRVVDYSTSQTRIER